MRASLRLFSGQNSHFKLYRNRIEIPSLKTAVKDVAVFHFNWLRDNCRCPQCFHPNTRQKLHSSGSINPFIKPKRVELFSKSLNVEWDDDEDAHKSVYDLSWLEKHNYNIPSAPLITPVFWDAQEYRKHRDTVDYDDFLKPHGFARVLRQIKDYGLAFLKNVPTTNHLIVEDVAKQFGVIKVGTFLLETRRTYL